MPLQRKPPVTKRSLFPFEGVLLWMGRVLICTGMVCNEWVLTKLLSPDGIVEIQNRVAIWLFDIVCISLGLCLVKIDTPLLSWGVLRRFSQAYPRTLAFSFGLVLTVLIVLCAEGIFYGLNHYRQENAVEEVSWMRIPSTDEEGGGDEHPPRRVHGWTVADPFLGYTLPKNAQITATMKLGGSLYQGTYTTDAYHRRLTPIDPLEQRSKFLLFFGCSMTFGLWVNDDETMPFYVGQYASHYLPYNYGVSGYGPHHMLAQLQSRDLTKDITGKHGIAIYTFIDHHIDRAIGTMRVYNRWEARAPFYMTDAHDRLVRKGDFTSGRPLISFLYWTLGKSQILKYYNITFPVRMREEHIRLTARIIEEARNAFHKQFPSDEFYVLLYPGVKRGKNMIPYFVNAGVKYLDYSGFVDWPQPGLTLADGAHPTAQGHRMVAAQLAKDLGMFDGNGER